MKPNLPPHCQIAECEKFQSNSPAPLADNCSMNSSWIIVPFLQSTLCLSVALAAPPSTTPYPPLTGEYSTAKAMTALYGSFNEHNQTSIWPQKKLGALTIAAEEPVRVQILHDESYSEDGVHKHFLLTWTGHLSAKGEDCMQGCHPCGVEIGVAVFAQSNNIWQVEFADLKFGELGAWGQPPDKIQLLALGPHTHGFVVHQGDMHQGIVSSYFAVYALGQNRIRSVFSIEREGEETPWQTKCEAFAKPKYGAKATQKICEWADERLDPLPSASLAAGEFFDLNLVHTFPGELSCAKPASNKHVQVVDLYRYNAKLHRFLFQKRTVADAPPMPPNKASDCPARQK